MRGFPIENIINYEETSLTEDSKAKLRICRKGTKYAEKIMNTSMFAISLWFACAADDQFLPPPVAFKTECLMDSWLMGEPINTIYNRKKSRWFDVHCSKD